MRLLLLLYSIVTGLVPVLSYGGNNEDYALFSRNDNLLSEKQLRSKSFREYEENEDKINIRYSKPRYCTQKAECMPLNFTTCFGVKISYSKTSLSLVPDITSQEEAQERLQKWHKNLIHIPKCWAVVQPFLCALFMPKCENGLVVLPSKEMCEVIQYPCRILNITDWPAEFDCSPYTEKCKNDIRESKFNTTSRCMSPLVQAIQETSYYEGIEGCGVQCHNPFFSDDERQDIRTFVKYGSLVAFMCNLFAVMTLIIDWKSTRKYPVALTVFYMNVCFLLVSIGFLQQFLFFASDRLICHKDGTLRTSEPSERENVSCVANFFFVYYSLIAGLAWFMIFAYAWYHSLKQIGKGELKERKDNRKTYYHFVAWPTPLVLTILALCLKEVDGDSLLGVCFVGTVNKVYRIFFLSLPLGIFGGAGLICFMKGVWTLWRLNKDSKELITSQGAKKLRQNIIRVCVFSSVNLIFGAIILYYILYDWFHYEEWKESFRKFIVCQLNILDDTERCRMFSQPSVLIVQIQLIALFGIHIIMATWVINESTRNTWSAFINRILRRKVIPVPANRHKLISRAFAMRKLLNCDGHISIKMSNSLQDPVGLNFELSSAGSNNITTEWANTLPKFITRRGALACSQSISSHRRNSMDDSEISISVRRVSVESRRHSLDSAVSVQAVEVTKTLRKRPRNERRRRRKTYKHKTTRKKILSRRNSTSSQASNLENEVMKALKITNFNDQCDFGPNMKRRPAIVDIEKNALRLLDMDHELSNHSYDDSTDNYNSSEAESETEPSNN